MRILFVSAEPQHTEMFLQVKKEIELIVNEKVESVILNNSDLPPTPFSFKINLKKEIKCVERIVDELNPDVLVVANDMEIRTLFIKICNLKGIPSITIQDGILTNRQFPPHRYSDLE